jgi:hypothetical protein
MRTRFFAVAALVIMLMTLAIGSAAAQIPPPSAPPKAPAPKTKVETEPPPPPAPKAPPSLPINVRIDVTITDQRGSAPPSKKTVSVVVADGQNGSVRSSSKIPIMKNSAGPLLNLPLNIDATPAILEGNKVRLALTLNVELPDQPRLTDEGRTDFTTSVTERVIAILESGKSMVVAQSADPISDRQVTIEVKATILK